MTHTGEGKTGHAADRAVPTPRRGAGQGGPLAARADLVRQLVKTVSL
jgi:hypothetical protein